MPKSIRQQVIDMATPVSPKRIENAQTALERLMHPERGIGDLATELHVPHELLFLYELAYGCWDDDRHSYGHIIQAGVHYGVTLCMLAQAAEHIVLPYLVYGIDPYQPQDDGDGYTYPHREAYAGVRHTISQLGLANRVCVCCFDSATFCEQLSVMFPVRLAFIDSNHTAAHVTREIRAIEPLVNPGGWLVFHDVFHTKLPEFSNVIETWICDNEHRYDKWLRLRKYPDEGHEFSHIPMSTVACRKKW